MTPPRFRQAESHQPAGKSRAQLVLLRSFAFGLLMLFTLVGCSLLDPAPTPIPLPPTAPPGAPIGAPAPGGAAGGSIGKPPGALARYEFTVTLDFVGSAAQVVEFIDVTNPGPDTWDQVVFHIPAHLDETEFAISGVSIFDGVQTQAARYLIADNFITVFLENPLPPNSGVGVSLVFGLQASQTVQFGLVARRPEGNIGFNSQASILQFINWYPALVPYRPGEGWLLWQPTQVGDPLVTEIADYRLTVIAPTEEVVVVSGGPTSREGRTWRFEMRGARNIVFVASANGYEVATDTFDGIPVFSYYLPRHSLAGQAALQTAGEALILFNQQFGRYPYNSLVIAEGAYLHSASGAGVIIHSYKGYTDYTGQPTELLIALMPQTLSQTWWGGVVGSNAVLEPWIMSGLTLYSEYLYYETYHPNLISWFWESRVEYWEPEGQLQRTAYDFNTTSAIYRDIQRQSVRFLVDVRDQIGTPAFNAFLQDYYSSAAFNLTDGDDFFQVLNQNSGRSIDIVVAQYFEVRAVPTIAATERRDITPTPPLVYVVQPGDTVLGIALRFDVDIELLRRANGIQGDILSIGQRLIIP